MIFDIFIQKLADAGFVPGKDAFIHTMPGTVTEAIMLRTPLSGTKIDPYIPNRYIGSLQVVTRDSEEGRGSARAKRVQKILTSAGRQHFAATAERGAVHLDICQPQTLPVRYPRLDGNGLEWSQVFQVVWGETPQD